MKRIIKNKGKRIVRKHNKKKRIVILCLIVSLVMIIGISYAWLRTVLEGEKNVKIVVGDLNLVLDESSTEGIQLTNVIPTYDDEGKTYEPYKFSLKNQSNIPIYYTLSLVDDMEVLENCTTTSGSDCSLLDPRDIRYEIKMGDRTLTGSLSDSAIINYGIIDKGETIKGELKVWLNINATNEAMGKVYLGKLRVFGTQQLDDSTFDQGEELVNTPEMDNNMIAVKHDGYNWVKTDKENGWYNYEMGIWANAITVSSSTREEYLNAPVGTIINMDDIETMWVWIPRYSYTIASENGSSYYGKRGAYLDSTPTRTLPGEIDIKFVDTNTKEKGTAKYLATEEPKNWYTPDAFTFGEEELSGIWVGKFETSSSNPTGDYGGGNTTSLDPMIKPNVTSWRHIKLLNAFTISQTMNDDGNRYGFSSNVDTHLMKNSEWAVVAYLSQSKYGKLGNTNFSGSNKEIYQNKSDSYITGCSYGSPSNGNRDYGCQYEYDNNIRTEDGSTGKGVGASTTGTIYGIYDMSGGSWEYVMGNYNNIFSNSGFTTSIDSRYYDLYTNSDPALACNNSECLSHGLSETSNWYNDSSLMVDDIEPWVMRSTDYASPTVAGIFSFSRSGEASDYYDYSFRLVMSPSK